MRSKYYCSSLGNYWNIGTNWIVLCSNYFDFSGQIKEMYWEPTILMTLKKLTNVFHPDLPHFSHTTATNSGFEVCASRQANEMLLNIFILLVSWNRISQSFSFEAIYVVWTSRGTKDRKPPGIGLYCAPRILNYALPGGWCSQMYVMHFTFHMNPSVQIDIYSGTNAKRGSEQNSWRVFWCLPHPQRVDYGGLR